MTDDLSYHKITEALLNTIRGENMNIYLSENLKRLRQSRNLTQERLADFLGVSFQSISKWERGEVYPDIEMLPEIASYFKVSVDNLLGVNRAEDEKEIQDMLTQFDNFVNDMEKKSELLKVMIKKFPNDFRIQVKQLGMLMCEEEEYGEKIAKIQAIYHNIQNNCTNDEIRIKAKHLMAGYYNRLAYHGRQNITFDNVTDIVMQLPQMEDCRERVIPYLYPPDKPNRLELSMESVETELACLYHGLFHYAFFDYFNAQGEYTQGRYEKEYIIELLEKCLEMLEFFYDDGNYGKMWRTIAYDYGHLGHLCFETGNEEKALVYLKNQCSLQRNLTIWTESQRWSQSFLKVKSLTRKRSAAPMSHQQG